MTTNTTAEQKKRKFVHGPRASQACRACASSKLRCDENLVCGRCEKKGVACVRTYPDGGLHERPIAVHHEATGSGDANFAKRSRANVARSSSGMHGVQSTTIDLLTGAQPVSSVAAASQRSILESVTPYHRGDGAPDQEGQITPDSTPFASSIHRSYDSSINAGGMCDPLSVWIDAMQSEMGVVEDLDFNDMSFLWNSEIPELDQQNNHQVSGQSRERVHRQLPNHSFAGETQTGSRELVSDLKQVYKASLGKWVPRQSRNHSPEPDDLFVDVLEFSRASRACNPAIADGLPSRVRDQLLIMVLGVVAKGQTSVVTSTFPLSQDLEKLAKMFLAQHQTERHTFIHVPTFRLSDCQPTLLAGCIAAGAVRLPSRKSQKFGYALMEALRRTLYKQSDKLNILTRDLKFLQAFALQIRIQLWSGDQRQTEMAGSFAGVMLNVLRVGGRLDGSSYTNVTPSPEDSNTVLEAKWRQWVHNESFKRLVFWYYVHCTHNAALNSSSMPFSYSELLLTLPASRHQWLARSAEEWKTAMQKHPTTLSSKGTQDIGQFLHNPMPSKDVCAQQDVELACSIASSCLLAMTWEDRQRHAFVNPHDGPCVRQKYVLGGLDEDAVSRFSGNLRLALEQLDVNPANDCTFILDFQEIHMNAPISFIQKQLDAESGNGAQLAEEQLFGWQRSVRARRAVWYSGQLIRKLRLSSEQHDFHIVAASHAALCLWAYSRFTPANDSEAMSAQRAAGAFPGNLASPSQDGFIRNDRTLVISLNGSESLESQKWISHGRGTPTILSQHGDDLPLLRVNAIMCEITRLLRSTYSMEDHYIPVLESLCQLLEAVGALG